MPTTGDAEPCWRWLNIEPLSKPGEVQNPFVAGTPVPLESLIHQSWKVESVEYQKRVRNGIWTATVNRAEDAQMGNARWGMYYGERNQLPDVTQFSINGQF